MGQHGATQGFVGQQVNTVTWVNGLSQNDIRQHGSTWGLVGQHSDGSAWVYTAQHTSTWINMALGGSTQSDTGQRGSTQVDSLTWSNVSRWIYTGQHINMEQERSTIDQHGSAQLNIRQHGSTGHCGATQSGTGQPRLIAQRSVNMDQYTSTHQHGTRDQLQNKVGQHGVTRINVDQQAQRGPTWISSDQRSYMAQHRSTRVRNN